MPTSREVEEVFLTKVALSDAAAFVTVTSAGVNTEWFTDPACKKAWEIQAAHAAAYGKPATLDAYVANALGITVRFAEKDDIPTLIESLRISTTNWHLRRAAVKTIEDIDASLLGPKEVHDRLLQAATSPSLVALLSPGGDGVSVQDAWAGFEEDIEKFILSGGVLGTPWPWNALTRVTGGQSKGDYSVFAGFRKAGKTDIGCVEIAVENTKECGISSLIITDELSLRDMRNRVCARWAEIPYRKFRDGTLTEVDIARVHNARDIIQHHASLRIEQLTSYGAAAINEVRAMIEKHEPDVVLWDGHQLAAGSDEWKEVYKMSRQTRRMAKVDNVSVIVTAQLNPDKVEASYKAYHQDCSVFVLAERDGHYAHCRTTEVREGYSAKWSMKVDRGLPLKELPYGSADGSDGIAAEQATVLE